MADDLLKKAAPFIPIVQEVATKYGVPPELMLGMLAQESRFNPVAVGPNTKYGTAKGIAQFIDATAQRFGVNQMDPRSSIEGMGKYLQVLGKMFNNDPSLMAAGYNAGEGRVRQAGGVPKIAQTQDYVQKVLQFMPLFQSNATKMVAGASPGAAPSPAIPTNVPQPSGPGLTIENLLAGADPASLVPRKPAMGGGMQGLLTALAMIGGLGGTAANIIGAAKGTGATGNAALKQSGDLLKTVEEQKALQLQQDDMAALAANPSLHPLLQTLASIGGREALSSAALSSVRDQSPSSQIAMARGMQDYEAGTPAGRAIASKERVEEAVNLAKATQPYKGIGEGRAATATAASLRKEMNSSPEIKDLRAVEGVFQGADNMYQQYLKDPTKKGRLLDDTLVIAFNKYIDPSVVKEGEFDRSIAGRALREKLTGYVRKQQKGGQGFSQVERDDFMNSLKTLRDGRRQAAKPQLDFFAKEAEAAGVDPARVVNLNISSTEEEGVSKKTLPKLEELSPEQMKSMSTEELESYLGN